MKARFVKERKRFEVEAVALLKSLNAIELKSNNPWPVFGLATPAGNLRLSVHTDLWLCDKPWFSGGGMPWIAGRFDNVQVAFRLTGRESNPYSSKWNHHYWHNWTDSFKLGLKQLKRDLNRVQTKPTPAEALYLTTGQLDARL